MPRLNGYWLDLRPIFFKILAKYLLLFVVKIRQKQAKDISCAILEDSVMSRVERCNHCFEKVHVGILPARHRRWKAFVETTMRRTQLCLQEMTGCVHFRADLRVVVERIQARKRKYHKSEVISIA